MQAGIYLATHRLRLILPSSFVALLFVLLAFPSNLVSALTGGAYTPLVSVFTAGIPSLLLPNGEVQLISLHQNEMTQIYLVSSIVLALILGSPMIAKAIFELLVPNQVGRRRSTVYAFTLVATFTLALGTLFGYFFFARFVFIASITPMLHMVGLSPILIDTADFYYFVLRMISFSAIVFAAPVYIIAAVAFHPKRKTWKQ